MLFVIGLNMPVTIQGTNNVCIFSALGLLFNIAGLAGVIKIFSRYV